MTLIVLSVIVAAAFLAVGAAKIRMIPMMAATGRRLGFPSQQFQLIGALEIVFAVLTFFGIWVSWLGSIGTLVLTIIAAVMIIAHARVADPPKEVILPAALGILAFILFLVHLYQPSGRSMLLISLSIVIALAYVMTGGLKIRMIPMARITADRLGYPRSMIRVVGWLEVACAMLVLGGIWVRQLGIVGASLLIATMIGAILSRARVQDAPKRFIPALVLGSLCLALLGMHV